MIQEPEVCLYWLLGQCSQLMLWSGTLTVPESWVELPPKAVKEVLGTQVEVKEGVMLG